MQERTSFVMVKVRVYNFGAPPKFREDTTEGASPSLSRSSFVYNWSIQCIANAHLALLTISKSILYTKWWGKMYTIQNCALTKLLGCREGNLLEPFFFCFQRMSASVFGASFFMPHQFIDYFFGCACVA